MIAQFGVKVINRRPEAAGKQEKKYRKVPSICSQTVDAPSTVCYAKL
jgi:hypothetical protein